MDKETERFILALLDSNETLTLATVREDGYPQATTAGFVHDGLTLYVATFPHAQKVRNIRKNPRVSLTIDGDGQDWNHIRGLSMGAHACLVTDADEISRVYGRMRHKFPQLAELPVPEDASAVTILRIDPEVISVLNYEKGFGHRELVRV